jgi:putative alpha-1,2-mannosidase
MRMAMNQVAYLYAYSDKPERGREIITKICSEFYGNTSSGMIGNDDCGQMSAWYIFSTLGFYPVNPVSGEYIIGQPQTKSAIVHLKDGKILKITNNNTKLVKLNGLQASDLKLTHKQVSAGGLLNF